MSEFKDFSCSLFWTRVLKFFIVVGGSSGPDGHPKLSPLSKVSSTSMLRCYSGPANSDGSTLALDRPMTLSEVFVAAEHALKRTISDPDLLKSLSSLTEFEVKFNYNVNIT